MCSAARSLAEMGRLRPSDAVAPARTPEGGEPCNGASYAPPQAPLQCRPQCRHVRCDPHAPPFLGRRANQRVSHHQRPPVHRRQCQGPDRIERLPPGDRSGDHRSAARRSLTTEWHLGILGRCSARKFGDTCASWSGTEPPGRTACTPRRFYKKDSEGSPYDDGSHAGDKKDDAVPPGGTQNVWPVPERAGPAPGEGSSVFWMYHSHVTEDRDVNAGLIGPMIVTAPGAGGQGGKPKSGRSS